jgi:CRISPR-associated protein Cmr3
MSTSAFLDISAFDTLFFRDGRPFDQLDAGLAEASSQFPPLPSTMSGMLALAIVRQAAGDHFDPADHDWYGGGELPSSGDTAHDDAIREQMIWVRGLTGRLPRQSASAPLRANGPYILRTTGLQRKLYVPWPSSLMIEKKSRLLRSVAPNASLVAAASDQLGGPVPSIRPLGASKDEIVLERVSDHWIEWTACCRYLSDMQGAFKPADRLEDFSLGRSDILNIEEKIGIAIDAATGTARAGHLYAAGHVRLRPGISLAVRLDSDRKLDPSMLPCSAPFGGEGRQVAITMIDQSMHGLSVGQFKHFKIDRDCLRLRLTALTPVTVGGPEGLPPMSGPAEAARSFAGMKIVSAVVDRPRVAGFWRDRRASGIRVVPAGSTWFVTIPTRKNAENAARQLADAAEQLRLAPPELAALGYGTFMIGNWP